MERLNILNYQAVQERIREIARAREEARRKREEAKRKKAARHPLQDLWDRNGAAIYAANQSFKAKHGRNMSASTRRKVIKDATVNGVFNAGAYAGNLQAAKQLSEYQAARERILAATNEIEAEKKIGYEDPPLPKKSTYIVPDMSWKQADMAATSAAIVVEPTVIPWTPTITPTSTPCPSAFIECLPTPTMIPSPTMTATPYHGPIITSPKPPSPHLECNLYTNQDADVTDAIIDGVGFGADVVSVVPVLAPVAPYAQLVGTVVEGVGFVKSSIELIQGDPTSMLVSQTTSATKVFVMAARLERMIPVPIIGSAGNLVSLGINLQPKITCEWVSP